jgi:UDP-glucose-4-epimerase GalE
MHVLVVGGAGYIGSHTVKALMRAGHSVVVFDNLSTGHVQAVPEGVRLVRGDILARRDLDDVFAGERYDVLMHFAAKASVGDSVKDPEYYYHQNVQGSLMLFGAARAAGVGGVIFSSSAACYGLPARVPITEDMPLAPINPYGWTKRMMEQILADFAAAYGLPSVSLRYFNAAGSEPDGSIGEDHRPETHLIPRVLLAARDGAAVPIFGTDYDTPDGTAIRDYVHVTDLADAHVRAVGAFERSSAKVFNLGTGTGYSVREVVESARRVTGLEIAVEETPRRAGDPPRLVASCEAFNAALGWRPCLDSLEKIIETAWAWLVAHPGGYGS